MTLPFLSVSLAMLYFGWLWHDRKATDRIATPPTSSAPNALKRTKRSTLRRLKVARRRPFTVKTVATPIARGAIQ